MKNIVAAKRGEKNKNPRISTFALSAVLAVAAAFFLFRFSGETDRKIERIRNWAANSAAEKHHASERLRLTRETISLRIENLETDFELLLNRATTVESILKTALLRGGEPLPTGEIGIGGEPPKEMKK